MARGDSRARSRARSRSRHGRTRRASRGRSPLQRSPPHRRQGDARSNSRFPNNWESTPQEYDAQKVYGLSLPRKVLSNRYTRELQIDGADIMDVRLSQVTTNGPNNWGLRSLAWGRQTVWEAFRSRQEAVFAGTLVCHLRGDSKEAGPSSQAPDLNAVLTEMTKVANPGQDPYNWDNRYASIKSLCAELAQLISQKGPQQANQHLLDKVRELQQENARLKSSSAATMDASARPSPAQSSLPVTRRRGTNPNPSRPASARPPHSGKRTPSTGGIGHSQAPPARRGRTAKEDLRDFGEDGPEIVPTDPEDEAPVKSGASGATRRVSTPSPNHDDEDDQTVLGGQSEAEEEDLRDSGPAPAQDTVQQFQRADNPAFLSECIPDNMNFATINRWISSQVGKENMTKVQAAADELQAALQRLNPGERPAVDAMTVAWGLQVSIASKLPEKALIKLLATCHHLAQE